MLNAIVLGQDVFDLEAARRVRANKEEVVTSSLLRKFPPPFEFPCHFFLDFNHFRDTFIRQLWEDQKKVTQQSTEAFD